MKNVLAAASLALLVGVSPLVSAQAATAQLKPYTMDQAVDMRASNLIGQRIYATADDVEGRTLSQSELSAFDDIGEINDVILTPEGQVKAVVLGIGGFLGLGERDLAVEMSSLRFVSETDGQDTFIVVNADKPSLMAMADEQKAAMAPAAGETGETVTETAATTGEAVEQTGENVAAATEQAGETVAEKVEQGAAATGEAVEQTGETVAAAGEAAVEKVEQATTDATTTTSDGTQVTTTETAAAPAAGMERERLVRPQVETEGYADVAATELTADDFTGKRVYGVDGEDIGEISDLVMSSEGQVEQAVLDVGGFLGIGERKIAVPLDELQLTRNADGDLRVYIQATQAQLEAQPEYVAQ